MSVENVLLNNPRDRAVQNLFGPLFNFLLEHHVSPGIIGLLFLIPLCIKLLPLLKTKDGKYDGNGILLIAVTIFSFVLFLYSQVKILLD